MEAIMNVPVTKTEVPQWAKLMWI